MSHYLFSQSLLYSTRWNRQAYMHYISGGQFLLKTSYSEWYIPTELKGAFLWSNFQISYIICSTFVREAPHRSHIIFWFYMIFWARCLILICYKLALYQTCPKISHAQNITKFERFSKWIIWIFLKKPLWDFKI